MPWVSRPVTLTTAQSKQLKEIATSLRSAEREKCRALIVLLLGEGLKNKEIAMRLGIHENSVVKWRGRWTGNNSDAKVSDYGELTGRPRVVLVPEMLERIKYIAQGKPPKGKSRWTIRALAFTMNLRVSTIQRALVELNINLLKESGYI